MNGTRGTSDDVSRAPAWPRRRLHATLRRRRIPARSRAPRGHRGRSCRLRAAATTPLLRGRLRGCRRRSSAPAPPSDPRRPPPRTRSPRALSRGHHRSRTSTRGHDGTVSDRRGPRRTPLAGRAGRRPAGCRTNPDKHRKPRGGSLRIHPWADRTRTGGFAFGCGGRDVTASTGSAQRPLHRGHRPVLRPPGPHARTRS